MNRYTRSQSYNGMLYKKHKFYKHLKVYLIFIGMMLFITLFTDGDPNFYPFAFWWGLGVVVHYLKTFGWSNLTQTTRQEPQEREYELPSEPEEEEFVELRQPQKAWRDRDLV